MKSHTSEADVCAKLSGFGFAVEDDGVREVRVESLAVATTAPELLQGRPWGAQRRRRAWGQG